MENGPHKWLYTIEEVIEIFGINANTVSIWESKGILSPVKTTSNIAQYLANDVEDIITQNMLYCHG